ncbi:MAG TPA: ribonuclease III [Ruminococcaceae bacterium]|nr:ribonuclease III [Oscillospiraceae bacterium]
MENANRYNTLTLAFLGDAVYSLMVRERLVKNSSLAAGKLHRMSVDEVNAKAQSEGAKKLLPILNDEETDIFKRGRNAHPHHSPKNQSEGDYHYATGLEALFGYLYLEGKTDRLNELFDIINKE